MGSFSDSVIGSYVTPVLLELGQETVATFRYEMGDVSIAGILGIKQDETLVTREMSDGTHIKVRTCTLIIGKDPTGPHKGVADPQLKGTFTEVLSGVDGRVWGIEPSDGNGVQASTGSLHRIALRELTAMAKGYPNREVTA